MTKTQFAISGDCRFLSGRLTGKRIRPKRWKAVLKESFFLLWRAGAGQLQRKRRVSRNKKLDKWQRMNEVSERFRIGQQMPARTEMPALI